MTVSSAAGDNLKKIRVRVNNWVQGKGYGPGGFFKNTAKHDVIFLLRYIADLEEAEGNRPREIDANTKAQDVPDGTIVVDRRGQPWISSEGNWWRLAKYVAFGKLNRLHPTTTPHTIIYTPKGGA